MDESTATVIHDGITYTLSVSTDENDITKISLKSGDPPQGYSREMYSWEGNMRSQKGYTP